MKTNKTAFVSLVAIAAVAMAPESALAAKKVTKKAKTHHATSHVVHSAPAPAYASESEVAALRAEIAKLRAENKAADSAVAQKVETNQQKVEEQFAEHEKHEKTHKDLLFFRGGYAAMTHNRNNELLVGNPNNGTFPGLSAFSPGHNSGDGWYIGAGFDHRLTDDLWGLTDIAALDGEVMFQYMNFGTSTNTLISMYPIPAGNLLAGGGLAPVVGRVTNQITQFTLTASPKLKFNQFGDFRPWIIPFGLSINVISPPSSGVTVLNPGLMLGVGGEYRLWESLWAGVDFRYNFTGDDLNYRTSGPVVLRGVSTDGLTAGGYLGFGF